MRGKSKEMEINLWKLYAVDRDVSKNAGARAYNSWCRHKKWGVWPILRPNS